jgi:Rieske Fe-S protein
MVIGTFVAIAAAAVFGIPTGILAAGFESKVQERQEARREEAAARAKGNWKRAINAALNKAGTTHAVSAFQGGGKHAEHFVKYVATEQHVGDASLQGRLYNFLHAQTKAGRYAEYVWLSVPHPPSPFPPTDKTVTG